MFLNLCTVGVALCMAFSLYAENAVAAKNTEQKTKEITMVNTLISNLKYLIENTELYPPSWQTHISLMQAYASTQNMKKPSLLRKLRGKLQKNSNTQLRRHLMIKLINSKRLLNERLETQYMLKWQSLP